MNQAAPRWSLTLYVSGASPLSTAAIQAVRRICDDQLKDQVDLQVVDVHEQPALVVAADVVALPTLVKDMPAPLRQLVGDMSDPHRIAAALDLPVSGAKRPPDGEPDAGDALEEAR